MTVEAEGTALQLLEYCRQREWAGHDPYDALNSPIFRTFPFLDSKVFRLAAIQAMKRSPIDVRAIARIPATQNPKALGLFISALLRLSDAAVPDRRKLVASLVERLVGLRSADDREWCWGYSFPWQTRTQLIPRGAPNVVCTTFAANALLDVYEESGDRRCLEMAASAAEYILAKLYWSDGQSTFSLSYPMPGLRQPIHNANFLGAALFCRVSRLAGMRKFVEPALRVARYSAGRQRPDGSWAYGEGRAQQWVDNFHTGYNLCALRDIGQYAGTDEFEANVRQGYDFYKRHFTRVDGAPRYFHDRTYPIDIHSAAQAIVTFVELRDLDSEAIPLAHRILQWTMENMWDSRGFFYYRVYRFGTARISYMRWSQAWMLSALSQLTEAAAIDSRRPVVEALA